LNVVRWGLIGCGDISRKRVAPALRVVENSQLVAVSRANTDLLDSCASEFGARRKHSDWRQLVRDEEIDAVYVATPVYLHVEQTIAAAESGKHILCEKPMALNVAECDKMIEACTANKVKLGVAYYRHFYPIVRRIKEVVQSGELGIPIVAQINAFEWFDPEPSNPRFWLLKPEQSGGGPMFDFGCHRLEVLLDIMGPVKDISGKIGNVLFDREVEDVASATLQFESGAFANLTVTHAAREPQDTFDLFCSQGSVHVPVLNEGKLRIVTQSGERTESLPTAKNIHQPLIEDFVSAVLTKREPVVAGEIGRSVAALVEKIYE